MNQLIALYTTLALILAAGPPDPRADVRPTGTDAAASIEAPTAATEAAPPAGPGAPAATPAAPDDSGFDDGASGDAGTAGLAAPPSQDDVNAILRRTSAAYERMTSVSADFEQVLRNTLLGRTTRSTGRLYQEEPDKFLMDFSDPEGDLIVSDGRYFWMYFPSVDDQQVIRTPRGGQGLDLQAQFIGDIVSRFEATYHGTEELWGRTVHVMTLDPRPELGYRQLKVWIDEEDDLVRRFEITEENGNVRRVLLRDMEINPELPAELFEFSPPPGTFVVEQG